MKLIAKYSIFFAVAVAVLCPANVLSFQQSTWGAQSGSSASGFTSGKSSTWGAAESAPSAVHGQLIAIKNSNNDQTSADSNLNNTYNKSSNTAGMRDPSTNVMHGNDPSRKSSVNSVLPFRSGRVGVRSSRFTYTRGRSDWTLARAGSPANIWHDADGKKVPSLYGRYEGSNRRIYKQSNSGAVELTREGSAGRKEESLRGNAAIKKSNMGNMKSSGIDKSSAFSENVPSRRANALSSDTLSDRHSKFSKRGKTLNDSMDDQSGKFRMKNSESSRQDHLLDQQLR